MYDYDRRTAAQARNYQEVVALAVKQHGVKPGAERKVREAGLVARELDQELKEKNSLNPDDEWAHGHKDVKLWADLQKVFSYCFGYDPPALEFM